MLTRPSRQQRSGENGQTLILALAFIAFFGLLISSVLNFGGVTALQHTHTEATATKDAGAEGGAAFAAADAVLSGLPCQPPGTTRQLTMMGGNDVASYTVKTCRTLGVPGHCLLCVLNQTPITPGTVPVPGTSVLGADEGTITTTGGDAYINGSIASGTELTAGPAGSAHVRVWNGASMSGCVCNPTQVLTYRQQFPDPLLNVPAPSPVAVRPEGCANANWDANAGCSASFDSGRANIINPGLWNSLSITGRAHVTANPGVYVVTGPVRIDGGGNGNGNNKGELTGTGVTIYLACPNYGPAGNPCPASGTGGNISVSGEGNLSVTAPGSPQYTNVGGATGNLLGADLAILADPHLLDPRGVSSCIGGSGCLINVAGDGATIDGSIDTRGGGLSIGDHSGLNMPDGLLVTNSLFVGVSDGNSPGLTLLGPGTFSGPTPCYVFDDSVTSPGQGSAVIQSGCGKYGLANGVVQFDYP